MGAGALYDLAFAAAILFFPVPAARLLGLALPADPVYLRLNGVFLVLLAALYLLAFLEPRRYLGVVVVAIGGRILGAVYLAWVWAGAGPIAFAGLAGGDLFFALLHAFLLRAARRAGRGGFAQT